MAYELYTRGLKPARSQWVEVLRKGEGIVIGPPSLTVLNDPKWVELLYDESVQRVGIQRASKGPTAYRVEPWRAGPGKVVYCRDFFRHFDLFRVSSKGRIRATWDVTDEILSFMRRQKEG